MDEDDKFWTAYIASTPAEDADFAGCGQTTGWIFLAILGGLAVIWFVSR
jgi:hypothetical protein